MLTRSGPQPDAGAAGAGGGKKGTGLPTTSEKTCFRSPHRLGGLAPQRAGPAHAGAPARSRSLLQVWEEQPPGLGHLISLGRCWAGLRDHPESIGLAAFRSSETASQFPASEAAEPQQVASVARVVLEQNAGRGPPALRWPTVRSLKASAYGEVPRPHRGRRSRSRGVDLRRRAAWACASPALGQGVETGGCWLPTGRRVLSPQCFSFKTNYPCFDIVTFYTEICMSASL